MSETILYIVLRDNGYEGLDAPRAIFLTREEADLYAKHLNGDEFCTYGVREAPLLRFTPARVNPATLPQTPNQETAHGDE